MTSTEQNKWTRSDGDSWDIVSSVGFTALGVAAQRAIEATRPDALAHDQYAQHFIRAAGEPRLIGMIDNAEIAKDSPLGQMRNLGVRTRFFDEFFLTATKSGATQAVILAAGLDVRGHRLPWPAGTTVFELDQPKVLEFKDGVLDQQGATPTADRRTIAVDLREDWPAALKAAGFDPSQPTAWSAEGLLPYLPGAAQELLFERIAELSAPGSAMACEGPRGKFDVRKFMNVEARHAGEHDAFKDLDLSDLVYADDERADPEEWFGSRGWNVTIESIVSLGESYGLDFGDVPEDMRELSEEMLYFTALLPR